MNGKHAVAAIALALAAFGCEGGEARLAELTEQLDEVRGLIEEARGEVEERKGDVQDAEEELAAARADLREREQALVELEREIAKSATDPVLFRTIQKRLLEDADLERVAIEARVQNGVVLLSGAVPSAELRNRALEIARDVPGVVSVDSRIQVSAPDVASPGPDGGS